ncbi:hypothetical protein ElyMa_004511700 [Elysia marginata]|uniref:PHTF1/2 N-terminal domain-containing protein n=1 Tax=Elysia marginata TaxID=1093978 RepID=A0AAV4HMK0_9GAST|nr:hypothetical protein ElyMa_004511700 [Elysia marginata]
MPNSPLALLNKDDSLTSRDKLDLSRELHSSFTSSASGLSFEEITCEEVDDIASYSARYLNRKRYRSPNMSRRKEDFTSTDQGSETSSRRSRRSQARNVIYTSTPQVVHRISTHDHYYDGMLLRSGHKLEGVKWHMDKDGMVYEYDATGTSLLPTPIGHSSDLDMSRIRGSLTTNHTATPKILTTTTITKTTTTTYTANDGKQRLRGKRSLKEVEDEMAERKLMLDEAETEKHRKQDNNEYYIKHMYDVDAVDYGRSAKTFARSSQNHQAEVRVGFFTYFTTLITTIITTVTTTITEGSLTYGVKSAAVLASNVVVTPTSWLVRSLAQFFSWLLTRSFLSRAVEVPTRWLLRRIGRFSSWLVMKSATLLLYEIEMKQRRRHGAGCCCWLFPLLLLFPLALLVLYYWQSLAEAAHLSHVGHISGQLGSSVYTGLFHTVMTAAGALSSGWSHMWLWLVAALTMNSTNTQAPVSLNVSKVVCLSFLCLNRFSLVSNYKQVRFRLL